MKQHTTIYSIHSSAHSSGLLQIETVVSGGIYNFSILGISSKYTSDLKQKTYTALRVGSVLNLKSENRKITVNFISDYENVQPSFAELAVCLSCYCCIHEIVLPQSILAVGGISITGKVIPSGHILQSIGVAQEHNIPYIVCAEQDLAPIDSMYIEYANQLGIIFVTGDTLASIAEKIKKLKKEPYPIPTQTTETTTPFTIEPRHIQIIRLIKNSHLLWSIFIALCGKHNLLIQDNGTIPGGEIDFFSIMGTLKNKTLGQIIHTVCQIKVSDLEVESYIKNHSNLTVDELYQDREISDIFRLSSFIYFHNLGNIPLDTCQQYYNSDLYHKISTCTRCPCGSMARNCKCIQRNIQRYMVRIQNKHLPYYDICIEAGGTEPDSAAIQEHLHELSEILLYIHKKQFERYKMRVNIPNLTFDTFKDDAFLNKYTNEQILEKNLNQKAKSVWKKVSIGLSIKARKSLLQIAQTLQDIEELEGSVSETITSKNLLLAFSYIPKMGF